MKIVVGDETGLVKVVNFVDKSNSVVSRLGVQTREQEAASLCWTGDPGLYSSFTVAKKNGAIQTWKSSKLEESVEHEEVLFEPVGLHFCTSSQRLLSVGEDGGVQVLPKDFHAKQNEEENDEAMDEDFEEFETKGPISASCFHNGLLAVGGKENLIAVWDVSQQAQTWRAKNVPPDKLDLEVPIWAAALAWVGGGGGGGGEEGGGAPPPRTLLEATAHRHVRLYDLRAGRRPQLAWAPLDHRATAAAAVPSSLTGGSGPGGAVVADGAGEIRDLCLRTGKLGVRYEGPSGSVRALAVHPTAGLLASVGLDRVARVHRLGRRLPLAQAYLKQRLNAVLFSDEVPSPAVMGDQGKSRKDANSDNEEGSDWESFDENKKGDYDEVEELLGASSDEDEDDGGNNDGNK